MTTTYEVLDWLANKYDWTIRVTEYGTSLETQRGRGGRDLTFGKVAAKGTEYIRKKVESKDQDLCMDTWLRDLECCYSTETGGYLRRVIFPGVKYVLIDNRPNEDEVREDKDVNDNSKSTYSITYRTTSERDFHKGCTVHSDTDEFLVLNSSGHYALRFKDKEDQNRTILGVLSAQIVEECDPACMDLSAPTYTISYRACGMRDTFNGCRAWKEKNAPLYKLENNGFYTLRFVDAFGQKQLIAGVSEAQIIEERKEAR